MLGNKYWNEDKEDSQVSDEIKTETVCKEEVLEEDMETEIEEEEKEIEEEEDKLENAEIYKLLRNEDEKQDERVENLEEKVNILIDFISTQRRKYIRLLRRSKNNTKRIRKYKDLESRIEKIENYIEQVKETEDPLFETVEELQDIHSHGFMRRIFHK